MVKEYRSPASVCVCVCVCVCAQIIFCSRTHSQLTQFASELRRTAYPQHISMVALASRKVLCINKDVSQLGNANLLNQTCFDMQQVRATCHVEHAGTYAHRLCETLDVIT